MRASAIGDGEGDEDLVRLDAALGVPGTGLGLSIARSLVEMNGGSLTLSQAPAGGTIFEIRLPRLET